MGVERLTGGRARALAGDAEELFDQCGFWIPSSGETVVLRIPDIRLHTSPIEISPRSGQRHTIIVEPGTEVLLIERGIGDYSVDILVQENAKIRYFSTSTGNTRTRRFAYLEKDASILWIDAAFGERVDAEVTTFLAGEGSNAEFTSVFLGKDEEQYTIKSRMVHSGNKSTSNMLTRAVLLDCSRGDYEGMIRILPHAAGCDAYQKEDTLLLSSEAKMDAQPNLEISNEDVRCSHGVGLGRIDDEKLFYLLSRGIPKTKAIQLIVEGFFGQIIDRMGTHGDPVKKRLVARL